MKFDVAVSKSQLEIVPAFRQAAQASHQVEDWKKGQILHAIDHFQRNDASRSREVKNKVITSQSTRRPEEQPQTAD